MKCKRFDPDLPPIGATYIHCECPSCRLPISIEERKLKEQVIRGLLYMQSLHNKEKHRR